MLEKKVMKETLRKRLVKNFTSGLHTSMIDQENIHCLKKWDQRDI